MKVRSFKTTVSALLACSLLVVAQSSAQPTNVKGKKPGESDKASSGKSVDLSEAFEKKKIEPFEYVPVISEFWEKVEKHLKEKQYVEILKVSQKELEQYGEITPEGQEAYLAMGIGFSKLKLKGIAFFDWMMVANSQKGTMVGDMALFQLSQLLQNNPMSTEDLFRLFDNYQVENRHPDIQDLVSYYKGLALLKYGHSDWGVRLLDQVRPESYWGQMYLYWSAVALVAADKVKEAEEIFKQLYEQENQAPRVRDLAGQQLARLIFEKGEFEKAFALYEEKRDLGLREKGRLLLEKAWTKFYLGDYGRSMGILHALKSPFFKASQTYEAFILEMLIFRQLCQYDFVKFSADVFRKRFGKSIKRIQARATLKRDPNLFGLAVMNLSLQDKANLIALLREDVKSIEDNSALKNHKLMKRVRGVYKTQLKRLQFEMDLALEPALREVGNELLRADEQIKFLEYISSLDALKLSEGKGGEAYKASRISNFEFEKIYWPVSSEYWYDELEDYSMKISSVCETETDKDQRKLEETFK
ncbi:MAG: hypothetical protein HRT45_07315 [Bdellovibrionales bacterium]|nr:hypothetical protein [Bdellovibrionales bacterium]